MIRIYLITILIIIIIKLFYNIADINSFLFILNPVVFIINIFGGTYFYFEESIGFYDLNENIIIGKSCAGINFLLILFSMLVFTFIHKFKRMKNKYILFVLFLILSYIITIFANSSRIIVSMLFLNLDLFYTHKEIIHKSIGVICYFSYLLVSYLSVDKIIKKVGEFYEKSI